MKPVGNNQLRREWLPGTAIFGVERSGIPLIGVGAEEQDVRPAAVTSRRNLMFTLPHMISRTIRLTAG